MEDSMHLDDATSRLKRAYSLPLGRTQSMPVPPLGLTASSTVMDIEDRGFVFPEAVSSPHKMGNTDFMRIMFEDAMWLDSFQESKLEGNCDMEAVRQLRVLEEEDCNVDQRSPGDSLPAIKRATTCPVMNSASASSHTHQSSDLDQHLAMQSTVERRVRHESSSATSILPANAPLEELPGLEFVRGSYNSCATAAVYRVAKQAMMGSRSPMGCLGGHRSLTDGNQAGAASGNRSPSLSVGGYMGQRSSVAGLRSPLVSTRPSSSSSYPSTHLPVAFSGSMIKKRGSGL